MPKTTINVYGIILDCPSNYIWAHFIFMEEEVTLLGEQSVILWALNWLEKNALGRKECFKDLHI